jgi:type IV pilus assembly protein PilW
MLSRLNASRWFIGTNSRGGRSLYQGVLTNTAGTPAILNQEVAENVQNMVITYLVPSEGGYVSATTVGTRWDQVTAINLSLTFQTQDAIGTNGLPLTRTISNVVTLRNRNQ